MKLALFAAVTMAGLVFIYRYCFQGRDVRVSDDWLRDMRAAEGAEDFAREMDDSRVVRPPEPCIPSLPVHPGIESRYTEPVK